MPFPASSPMLYTFAAKSVIHGPAAAGSLLEMQNLRPHPHLLTQTLHLIKILGDPCARERWSTAFFGEE